MNENLRLPPHSIDAEQSLLGALLQNNDSFVKVSKIDVLDFYKLEHRKIYEVISTALGNQQQVDVLTVYEILAQYENNSVTLEYLNSIVQNTPFATNIEGYAAVVKERALLRNLIAVNTDIIEQAFYPKNKTAQEILSIAQSNLALITQEETSTNKTFKEIALELLFETEELFKKYAFKDKKNILTGVESGLVDLDAVTLGFQKKDLIILAARPSMGKTALAVNIAENVAFNQDLPVAIFSMEMSSKQIVLRIVASQAKIAIEKIRTGNLDYAEWERISSFFVKVATSKIVIDETPNLSIAEMRIRANQILKNFGAEKLGLIMVDYLQLMSGSQKKYNDNRTNEISEISRGLKGLAKEMDCPVIALSQLNRSVEQRPNKMPLLSDLRESGAIEQDADLILFIYRDEYYHPNSDRKGIAEVKIAKNRNGKAGIGIGLLFQAEISKFSNLEEKYISYE